MSRKGLTRITYLARLPTPVSESSVQMLPELQHLGASCTALGNWPGLDQSFLLGFIPFLFLSTIAYTEIFDCAVLRHMLLCTECQAVLMFQRTEPQGKVCTISMLVRNTVTGRDSCSAILHSLYSVCHMNELLGCECLIYSVNYRVEAFSSTILTFSAFCDLQGMPFHISCLWPH